MKPNLNQKHEITLEKSKENFAFCKKIRYKKPDQLKFNVILGIILFEDDSRITVLTGKGKQHDILKSIDEYGVDDTNIIFEQNISHEVSDNE